MYLVVKLFNAIRTQQKATEVAVTKVSEKHKATSAIEKARNGKKKKIILEREYD